MQALLATFLPGAAMEDFVVQENEQFVHMLDGRIRTEFGDGREIGSAPATARTTSPAMAATGTRTSRTPSRGW